jgi:hypothetical protein
MTKLTKEISNKDKNEQKNPKKTNFSNAIEPIMNSY